MEDTAVKISEVDVRSERRSDGTIVLCNGLTLPPVVGSIPQRLKYWANVAPEKLFLSQDERRVTYCEAERVRRRIAAQLLNLPISSDRPLAILGENGINHALIMLAATSVGLPVAIVSPSYIAPGARPWQKFRRVIDTIEPGVLVADNVEMTATALAGAGITCIDLRPLLDLSWLDTVPPRPAQLVDQAETEVGLDTVAKLLFTSGSTGQPKAVPNTQRMMVSNMLGLATVWPFLSERPPVSVDWLPWNHTFGGNCCFNTTLWFGGHSHIDSGRPTPGGIGRSVEALKKWRPSLYYNVPVGFEAILPFLESDAEFAGDFLGRLDFVFNGGAPLPGALRTRLEDAAPATIAKLPMFVAGWGATETAPFSSVLYFDQPHANNLGAPIPGTQIKMVPSDGRYELRVKGPNVMPGYWRDREATAAAFDEEGFYKIGDAGKFVDPANPAAGLLFDGRVAENFKLTSGTWVNVGALRLAVVSASEKLISDVVVTGEGRGDIGLVIFPNEDCCHSLLRAEKCEIAGKSKASAHPVIKAKIASLLRQYNADQLGSSTRIARFAIAHEPPSAAHDEITDKGYLNQRRILSRRAELVEALYLEPPFI